MCGVVTGALMVIGLHYGHETPDESDHEKKVFLKTREFLSRFEKLHGTVICRELLGCDLNTPEGYYYAKTEGLFTSLCPKFVETATKIVTELIENKT